METEQLKSVLQAFKTKVAEINLDAAIEALDAVYRSKEDLKRVKIERDKAVAELVKAQSDCSSVRSEEKHLRDKIDSLKKDARARLAELAE